jgi:hypothetical protein
VADHRAETLAGHWVHSHEEDTETERVFRPASYDFPRARRGRDSFELRPDGTYVERAPGPADAPVESGSGSWSLEGSRLELGDGASYEIAAAEPDRLTLKR